MSRIRLPKSFKAVADCVGVNLAEVSPVMFVIKYLEGIKSNRCFFTGRLPGSGS